MSWIIHPICFYYQQTVWFQVQMNESISTSSCLNSNFGGNPRPFLTPDTNAANAILRTPRVIEKEELNSGRISWTAPSFPSTSPFSVLSRAFFKALHVVSYIPAKCMTRRETIIASSMAYSGIRDGIRTSCCVKTLLKRNEGLSMAKRGNSILRETPVLSSSGDVVLREGKGWAKRDSIPIGHGWLYEVPIAD